MNTEEINLKLVDMKNKYIFLLSIIVILFSSCNKSEIETFADKSSDEMINILGEDAEVSFDLIPETSLTYDIKALVSGFAVDYERTVNIVATESSTAVEGTHYTITECVIPANKVEGECKLTLMAPDALAEGDSLILELEVLKTDKLLPGLDAKLRYKFVGGFPSDWPDSFLYGFFFGDYSKTKYKFLIGLFGSIEGVAGVANWGNFMSLRSYQFYVFKSFEDYKSNNPDLLDSEGNLLDENNVPVIFPAV